MPASIVKAFAVAEGEIPNKIGHAIRVAVFWIALPFIGLLLAGDRYFADNGTSAQVAACLAVAILSILIAVYWERLLPGRWRPKAEPALGYLRDEDAELGGAIRDMVWCSAWGKWYTAQSLANSAPNPVNEQFIMSTATHLVLDALTNGQLEVRGRRPGQMDYEPIPRTHWRSTALHMIPDNRSLWKMILIPRGGAEITPEGSVIGRDQDAVQRTNQLTTYDSLIISARQFEKLWPLKHKPTDAARRVLLKKAKKAGADPAELAKLSRN
jgi:hypothetical protein